MARRAAKTTEVAQSAAARASLPGKLHKNIVLFSDGTGNSSAKLFKTNVWRMYEAVDLGPSAARKRDQIAYYDNGVGTSGFKPLAILGGVFGFGLKRNALEIYRYACRNYRPGEGQRPGEDTTDEGDHIFGFGFSRGAFTMRLVIGLIADQGLVPYTNEIELKRKAAAAYRQFCATGGRPRYAFSPVRLLRWLIRSMGDSWRKLRGFEYEPEQNYRPVIRFIGVWDTVAAYGGPIAELTRAIDNWIVRLGMPDHRLDQRVQLARHALALDDERDSFHPLLWDELNERDLIAKRKQAPKNYPAWLTPNRLEQVWFCGMHADVGGGYPDESLSYVSLLWMLDEAKKAGLRTLGLITERYRALANSFGPIHDSRSGLAAYYRYQPRNIQAWLDPVDDATLSLRDPAIRDDSGPRGILLNIKIHESVIARIASGTDRYAPFALPPKFLVHPPGPNAENMPLADSDADSPKSQKAKKHVSLISADARKFVEDEEKTEWLRDSMGRVGDRVWFRRWTYFATLIATLLLVAMPFWIAWALEPPVLSDGRTWIGSLIGLLRLALPGFLGGWVRVYEHNAFYFLLLCGLIALLMMASTRIESGLRDRARELWKQAFTADSVSSLPKPDASIWQKFRTSHGYQRGLQIFKWHVLPNIFGPGLLVVAAWALFGIYAQARLPSLEKGEHLCAGPSAKGELGVIGRDFLTSETCNYTATRVTKGVTYEVSFYVVDSWSDGKRATAPDGLSAQQLGFWGYVGAPFKRVINANYLQPIIEIRPLDDDHSFIRNVYLYPLEMRREGDSINLYRGQFTAPRTGELNLFVNDAVMPFAGKWAGANDFRRFYRLNRGSACVIIARTDASGDNPVKADKGICKLAAERARQREQIKVESKRPYLTQ